MESISLSTSDSQEAFYAVGTMYHDASEREPTRGRIILFSVVVPLSDKAPPVVHCVAEALTNGCVFSITCMKGKLVAAVNSGVCSHSHFDKFAAHRINCKLGALVWFDLKPDEFKGIVQTWRMEPQLHCDKHLGGRRQANYWRCGQFSCGPAITGQQFQDARP